MREGRRAIGVSVFDWEKNNKDVREKNELVSTFIICITLSANTNIYIPKIETLGHRKGEIRQED